MKQLAASILSCLSSVALLAQPMNDEPCGALELPVSDDCSYTTVDNTGGSVSAGVPVPACGNLILSDVWYMLTVPETGLLVLSTDTGMITDAAMALYSAPSCTGPFSLIRCDDDSGPGGMPLMVFTDLEPGSELYLRIWAYGDTTGTFQLCAHAPASFPEADCTYLLQMSDTDGDGWGDGAQVDVSINGTPLFTDSLEYGTLGFRAFGVNIGDVVVLEYTSGAWNNENGVRLQLLGNYPAFFDLQTNISTGVIYSDTADCLPPPPTPGDCSYAALICHDTTFLPDAFTVGSVADLDMINGGCLASGERKGIWIQFNIATDGTLAFTLAPGSPTDVDFAIWGPLDSITCPPAGVPSRCSYSAVASAIGLSAVALDASEGAGGDGWVRDMDVLAGERYMLYIDNYSMNDAAIELTWQFSGGASLTCPEPPLADFSASSPLVLVGEPVDFTDLSSNAPTSWSWSFPGGEPSASTLQDPTGITYALPGCFDVTLTAFNPGGGGTTTQTCAVQVEASTGIAPVTSFSLQQEDDGFTVRSQNANTMVVTLFDALGRAMHTIRGTTSVRVPHAGLATGQYILTVQSENEVWTRQVVIAR